MLDLICLWVGRIIVGIILLIVCAIVLRLLAVPLRRPWYFIKHLMPWHWVTEKHWKKCEDYCRRTTTEQHPRIADARCWRKGRFGVLTFPKENQWWSPKHHLFIIKKG